MLSPSPLYNLCLHNIFETFSLPSIQWHSSALCQLCCSYSFLNFQCGFPLNSFQPHASSVYRVPNLNTNLHIWEDHFALGRFFSLFSLSDCACVNVLSRFLTCWGSQIPPTQNILWFCDLRLVSLTQKIKITYKNFCSVCLSRLETLKFNIVYKVYAIYLLLQNITCQARKFT